MNFQNECGSTIFLKITNKAEIAFIKSFVNSNNKASGPNSVLHRIFLFLKNRTGRSFQPVFYYWCFPLKFRLDYSKYHLI